MTKSFSIKEIISEEKKATEKDLKSLDESRLEVPLGPAEEFTPIAFEKAWDEFADHIKSDGTRVVSMFKSIKTEVDSDMIIRIHLSNAAQKDLFIENYKQKIIRFMNTRFGTNDFDIETVVDISEKNDILYSDEQKYNYLTSKYPELKDLKKAFNLDLN